MEGRKDIPGWSLPSAVTWPRFRLSEKPRLEPGQEVLRADGGAGGPQRCRPGYFMQLLGVSASPSSRVKLPWPPPTLHSHAQSQENEVLPFLRYRQGLDQWHSNLSAHRNPPRAHENIDCAEMLTQKGLARGRECAFLAPSPLALLLARDNPWRTISFEQSFS